MPRESRSLANQKIREALQNIYAEIRRFNLQVTVHPHYGSGLVTVDALHLHEPKFDIGPIVLTVPQRANTRRISTFYVVIKGTIVFARTLTDGHLTTSSFATRVAYFRELGNRVEHVYGAHYDLDETKIGHPVFHSQMTTTASLLCAVGACHAHMKNRVLSDLMSEIPRNIRLPTAQMDFFAVLLQVCSDHLIDDLSGEIDKSRYRRLMDYCTFFRGYRSHEGMTRARSWECFRSHHWYRHTSDLLAT